MYTSKANAPIFSLATALPLPLPLPPPSTLI